MTVQRTALTLPRSAAGRRVRAFGHRDHRRDHRDFGRRGGAQAMNGAFYIGLAAGLAFGAPIGFLICALLAAGKETS